MHKVGIDMMIDGIAQVLQAHVLQRGQVDQDRFGNLAHISGPNLEAWEGGDHRVERLFDLLLSFRIRSAKEALKGAMDHKAARHMAVKAVFKLFAETINVGGQANGWQEIDAINRKGHSLQPFIYAIHARKAATTAVRKMPSKTPAPPMLSICGRPAHLSGAARGGRNGHV